MPVPPVFKSPAFLTGLGTVGSGAVGIGGWQIVEETYPSGDRSIRKSGFHWNPPPSSPQLEANASALTSYKNSHSKFEFNPYDCFKNFFPGVEVKWVNATGEDASDTFKLEEAKKDIASDKWPVGCLVMDFSYQDENTFILKSELTITNGKFGWALWTGVKKMKYTDENNQLKNENTFNYHLLFLKNTGTEWDILGGYVWLDSSFTSDSSIGNLNVTEPGGDQNWIKTTESSKNRNYSGIWVSDSASDGKEIVEEVKIRSGASDPNGAEILGKTREDIKWANSSKYGFYGAYAMYEKNSGWRKIAGYGDDIGNTINEMYQPFKDKKGKWFNPKDYCKQLSSTRGLSQEDLYRLQNLCYRK